MKGAVKLDDLKQELYGNSLDENKRLAKENMELHESNDKLHKYSKELETEVEQLQNVCFALTRGTLCLFCGHTKCRRKRS